MNEWARIYWQGFFVFLAVRVLIVWIGWERHYRKELANQGPKAWPLMGIGSFLWPLFFPWQVVELVLVVSDRFDKD